jgi:pyridinium-3,5-bisthiocarboxylic acid mononucleotide nickel chelatase
VTVAYFDCFSGISGDMTLGALLDAGADPAVLHETVKALELDAEVDLDIRREQRGHVGGTRVIVEARERVERDVSALRAVIDHARAPEQVRGQARQALDLIADVEGRIHGHDASSAHLHELGGADTLVDLVGAFWLLEKLRVQQVYSSPLPAPRGMARDMPLPAPASVRVLAGTGAVFVESASTHELVTPTGAAILAVAARFERPAIQLRSIGYGVGSRDAPGNALAVWIGEEVAVQSQVTVIETNIDDMAPNLLAALVEDLMAAGALDATITPALMKKGRPGHLLTVMASPDLVARLTDHVLQHSTTLGVRLTPVQRVIADREIIEVDTRLGRAHAKVKRLGGRAVDVTPEYEDCRALALANRLDLRDVIRLVDEAARRQVGIS